MPHLVLLASRSPGLHWGWSVQELLVWSRLSWYVFGGHSEHCRSALIVTGDELYCPLPHFGCTLQTTLLWFVWVW